MLSRLINADRCLTENFTLDREALNNSDRLAYEHDPQLGSSLTFEPEGLERSHWQF